ALKAFDTKLEAVAGSTTGGRGGFSRGGPPPPPNFVRVNGVMGRELSALDNGDMAPTPATLRGYAADCAQLATVLKSWQTVNTKDLPALNATLAKSNVAPVRAVSSSLTIPACGAGLSAQDRRRVETHTGTTVSHSKADEDEDGDE